MKTRTTTIEILKAAIALWDGDDENGLRFHHIKDAREIVRLHELKQSVIEFNNAQT